MQEDVALFKSAAHRFAACAETNTVLVMPSLSERFNRVRTARFNCLTFSFRQNLRLIKSLTQPWKERLLLDVTVGIRISLLAAPSLLPFQNRLQIPRLARKG